jgi:tRNA pseudouridine38-40 synthase
MAQRYFIELSYDGSEYHGWQVQPNAKTIQETLNLALSTILRDEIYCVGCGRTDTGVHASQYFAHIDLAEMLAEPEVLAYRLNAILPPSIAVHRLFAVRAEAHARFSATQRSYRYLITDRKDPFSVRRKWEVREELDVDLMNEGARSLLGRKDYSCFAKSNTQTETNICDVRSAEWGREDHGLVFEISADRFLRNMVRAIVGTLVDLGKHRIDLPQLEAIVQSGNRSEAGQSVPAHGLYLSHVIYPDEIAV